MYTVGHGARSAAELVSMLEAAQVQVLVDVRAYPSSQRHPHFSRNRWTPRFREAAAALAARAERVCIMCAESDPAACHRSHIADWLVAREHGVLHLLAPGRAREHARHFQGALWPDA